MAALGDAEVFPAMHSLHVLAKAWLFLHVLPTLICSIFLFHQILQILWNFHYPNVTLLSVMGTEGMNNSVVFLNLHFLVKLKFPCYKG